MLPLNHTDTPPVSFCEAAPVPHVSLWGEKSSRLPPEHHWETAAARRGAPEGRKRRSRVHSAPRTRLDRGEAEKGDHAHPPSLHTHPSPPPNLNPILDEIRPQVQSCTTGKQTPIGRGCGVVSGQSHYLSRDLVRPQPGLEFNRQVHLEVGGSPGSCLTYQSPVYNPPAQSSVGSNVLNLSKPTPAPHPPPPPPPPPPATAPAPSPPSAPKLGQGGFKKICRTEEDSPSPFPGLASGVLEMRVKEGSKIRNLMGFAMARMQGEKADGGGGGGGGAAGGLRQVVFTGSGRAVTKTITCAEIMKRKVGSLHQLTKLRYKGVKEVWEESHDGGASEMTVHRTVPSISILLSKDPLDPLEPGYQPPETLGALWEEREEQTAFKRPPGPSPFAGYPECKRACLGEGGSVAPPSLSG
ncbi:unnamed protein product [Merluccius merluccius]